MEHKSHHDRRKKYSYVGIVAAIFLGLFAFFSIKYLYQARKENDQLIEQQIAQLQVFLKISIHSKN